MNKNTIYPDAVEERLNYIVEASKDLDFFDAPLHDECIREVFGEVLMDQWLNNTELNMDVEDVLDLYNKAAALSTINSLIDEGLIDTLETDSEDLIFVTEKGKQYFDSSSADPNNII